MVIMLSDVGGISGVRDTLNAVKVPPDVIEDIIAILQTNSSDLDPHAFRPVPGAWFGGGSSATTLATHTDKAHVTLSNAVLEAVSGLQATGDAMLQFDKEISAADADSEAVAQALLARTEQAVDTMDRNRHTPPVQHGNGGSDQATGGGQ